MSFSNQQDYMNQMNDNAQKMFEPWSKLNKAFLKNAEQMTEFSLDTMRSYSEIGLQNMREVADIDSPESAKDFSSKQSEVLNDISEQMLADAQRLTELGKSMQEDVMKVMGQVYGETNEKMQENMRKTADQATKTAQEFTQNMNKMAEKASEKVADTVKTAADATSNAANNIKAASATSSATSGTANTTNTMTSSTSTTADKSPTVKKS